MVIATTKAKLFVGTETDLTFIENIEIDDSFEHGGEGHAPSQPGIVGTPAYATDTMHWDENNRKHLYALIEDRLHHGLQNGEFETIWLTVPHEHKNQLHEALSHIVEDHEARTIPKNLYNMDDAHLLDALAEV